MKRSVDVHLALVAARLAIRKTSSAVNLLGVWLILVIWSIHGHVLYRMCDVIMTLLTAATCRIVSVALLVGGH